MRLWLRDSCSQALAPVLQRALQECPTAAAGPALCPLPPSGVTMPTCILNLQLGGLGTPPVTAQLCSRTPALLSCGVCWLWPRAWTSSVSSRAAVRCCPRCGRAEPSGDLLVSELEETWVLTRDRKRKRVCQGAAAALGPTPAQPGEGPSLLLLAAPLICCQIRKRQGGPGEACSGAPTLDRRG